jgi:hypothetical protein
VLEQQFIHRKRRESLRVRSASVLLWNNNDPARPSDKDSTYSPIEPRDKHKSSQKKKRSRSGALAPFSTALSYVCSLKDNDWVLAQIYWIDHETGCGGDPKDLNLRYTFQGRFRSAFTDTTDEKIHLLDFACLK